MGWLILLLLTALVGLALWRFGGLPRRALELVGMALLLGVAGYAWQGSPGLPGRPAPPPEQVAQQDSLFALVRPKLMERFSADAAALDAAEAMQRRGWSEYSVGVIKGALAKRPNSPDLWVGLGNALVMHGGGMVSPAAYFAYQRAAQLAPQHPGPPFFLGLAYIQGGQPEQAAAVWRDLLARMPADSPWRPQVAGMLGILDAQRAQAGGR